MRHQNPSMWKDEDTGGEHLTVDTSETSSRLAGGVFSFDNPLLIPSLFGSLGVLCVLIIICRTQLYRLLIFIIYGNGFYDRKSNSSRLKHISRHRQQHYMSSLSKP